MPYLALLRTWTNLLVVEILKHYCSCLIAQVGHSPLFMPSSRLQHFPYRTQGDLHAPPGSALPSATHSQNLP